ncbi:MAG: endonuclease MutS2 [Oscillospiraceae bacterium]|nr:endonuclease MutS2 [Oscillospiraceae bacterium]
MNKYYEALELGKILEMLSKECAVERTKQMALELAPKNDYYEALAELKKTESAFELACKYGSPAFYSVKDVSMSAFRAKSGSKLSLRELLDIAALLKQLQILSDYRGHFDSTETELDYLFVQINTDRYLETKINSVVVSEDEISDNASPALADIRRRKNKAALKLRENLDKMIKNTEVQKCLQESIVTMRDGRYVVPVKVEHKNSVPGLIHSSSSSGQTIFIEPMSVVEANNEIKLLESMEVEEIDRILMQLSSDCADDYDLLIGGYKTICILNLYFAKANLASRMKACVPKLSDEGLTLLKKARHPLIDSKKVVPIDITIGEEYDALIITGPNTGGKTVALKTVGLLTLMAMCGLLIPANEGSVVSVFEKVLVDIGDSQSIEESLSTFSAHTNKVVEILKNADENSLVLLDEIGSGTDPVEGAALAVAVIEQLKIQGAKMLVTTHYQELKLFALQTDGVENASCEFDVDTLRPTYRIIIGAPGKSNAFAISETLGMPSEIISRAKQLVGDENSRFEQVVADLEAQRTLLESQNREIEKAKLQQLELAKKHKDELEELERVKSAEIEKAKTVAMRIIEDTKAQSNALIDELEVIRKSKDKGDFSQRARDAKSKANSALDKMYDKANPVDKRKNENYVLPRALKRGDTVYVASLDKKGVVVSDPDSDKLFVQIGIMKTKVNLSDLRLADEEKISVTMGGVTTKGVTGRATRKVSTELDIRGQASDEGVYMLDAFIDDCVVSGLSTVTVIHGKGTGILRKAVHERLRRHKNVKSYRLGKYGEGEDGVTIVELK